MVYRAEITCCDSTSGCFSRLYPTHTDPIGLHCDWCSDRLHLVVVTSSPSCLFLSYSLNSLLLMTILGPFALSSGLSFSFHLSPSPPPPPQPHMCSTVQHPPRPSPFSLSFTIPYPSTTRSTSKRFGWAGPLEGHLALSCLSRIFLHQGPRQKPHTHIVVALGGKYL